MRATAVLRQLLLDLGTPPEASFTNFVAGSNTELLAHLRALVEDVQLRTIDDAAPYPANATDSAAPMRREAPDTLESKESSPGSRRVTPGAHERLFYIWGDAGSGRTHLLEASCHAMTAGRARLLTPQSPLSSFVFDPATLLYAIDDCDRLPPARQIAVFNLFNEIRAHPRSAFIATGTAPPVDLRIRDDLRTRLGWGLVYRLASLSDSAKVEALQIAARERGVALAADVPPYLMNHFRRDMPSLKHLLDELGQFSHERKRGITLALLRDMLAQRESARLPDQADTAPRAT